MHRNYLESMDSITLVCPILLKNLFFLFPYTVLYIT
jgi:hypothetical protein